MAGRIRPTSIRLDASTLCQLKCPVCPTAKGLIRQELGDGFLSFSDFKKLVDENLRIAHVELSNWGEVFLNPHIYDIIEYAYQKSVVLTAENGVNLNTVREEVLEGLVKYKFFLMSCSIDGASQETYKAYRRGGNFAQVIENIKIINFYKAKYRALLPLLKWQFVVFGHNEHDIESARKLAKKLGMSFYIKLNYDEDYAPIKNKELVRSKIKEGVASRSEYDRKYAKEYLQACSQLWRDPQINWDGRILGCCNNYWGDFGNVFIAGIENSLNGEKMEYARGMLMGKKEAKKEIPCATCKSYKRMQEDLHWLTKVDTESKMAMQPVYSLIHSLGWKRVEIVPSIIGSLARLFQRAAQDKCAKSTGGLNQG